MKDPTFLLQSGGVMQQEKIACSFSSYPVRYCKFEDIEKLDPSASICHLVPVGSVEFTRKYAEHVGIRLPQSIFSPTEVQEYLHRSIREGTYCEAADYEFIKPVVTKEFTGGFKSNVKMENGDSIAPDTLVWISEPVKFESEFRFYVQSFVNKWVIQGWARYDDLNVKNPEPDLQLVESIAELYSESIGPNAYSIDIGWRPDLGRYSLVEINDGWALGLYSPSDPQSNPPTRQSYADMMVSRWLQIVFCSVV